MIDKVCCEKIMIYLGETQNLDMAIISCESWCCGTCGKVYTETEWDYDDEEFINLADTYEELKNTEFYKSLGVDEEQ